MKKMRIRLIAILFSLAMIVSMMPVMAFADDADDMVSITFDDNGILALAILDENGESGEFVPYSGYLVRRGTKLRAYPMQTDGTVVSHLSCSGKPIRPEEAFEIKKDSVIKIKTRAASVIGVPEKIKLAKTGDEYQLNAYVQYNTDPSWTTPVYDDSISYVSSDPLVTVDESGLIKVTGEVPEDGMAVYVTAYAGSSNYKLNAVCKVVVGDFDDDRKVGSLTFTSFPGNRGHLMPHGFLTFTTYEDLDLEVSCYVQYKPTEKYNELMKDYAADPGKYSSDPALFNNDELGLADRESYFETIINGPYSDPVTMSLKAGESMTIANSSIGNNKTIKGVIRILEDSEILPDEDAQKVLTQLRNIDEGREYDMNELIKSILKVFKKAYVTALIRGYNPINGRLLNGGLCIDKEIRDQFVKIMRLPNQYYTVEITADELARLKKYISDPANNYFSFLDKNCANQSTTIWNTVFSDRPALQMTANNTGFSDDPWSLYIGLGRLIKKNKTDGVGGNDFYATKGVYDKEDPTVNEHHVPLMDSNAEPGDDQDFDPEAGRDAAEPSDSKDSEYEVTEEELAANRKALNKNLRMKVSKKGVMKLKWGKVKTADGYDIFVRVKGKKGMFKKKAATVNSGKKTTKKLKELHGKKISNKKKYKFAVKAYKKVDGEKVYIGTSKICK